MQPVCEWDSQGARACACRCSRMAQKSGGNRSWRVAAHWPHLMNAGPAASSTSLRAIMSHA